MSRRKCILSAEELPPSPKRTSSILAMCGTWRGYDHAGDGIFANVRKELQSPPSTGHAPAIILPEDVSRLDQNAETKQPPLLDDPRRDQHIGVGSWLRKIHHMSIPSNRSASIDTIMSIPGSKMLLRVYHDGCSTNLQR